MAANDREPAASLPTAPETTGEDAPLLVNIHFVSPSEGVPDDLDFQGLPAATTVGQLKDKIRDVLPMHPAHDEQRIIHQGRLLARESDTLLDVFGEDKLRTGDQQPLHLVVRTSNHHPSGPTASFQPAPVSSQTVLREQRITQQDASSQNDWRADVQRTQARIDALRNLAPSAVAPATDEQIRNIYQHMTGPAAGISTSDPTNGPATVPHPQSPPQRERAEVYILSSPTGPRGLLVKNGSELYATPGTFQSHRAFTLPQPPLLYPGVVQPAALNYPPLHTAPPVQNQPQRPQGQHQPVQVRIRIGHRAVGHGIGHPNNAVGAAALVAAAWPHIWLVIRLIFFIWWFTSNDSSWTRVFTMAALAAGVLVMNAGFLNRFANQALGPIRQHLDGLLHMAGPNQQRRQHVPQPQAPPPAGANGEPGVGLVGLHERRDIDNAGAVHLVNFFRRIERAGLLFLASIAPGVAERHIAQLEAHERAERERRERQEAAAAAAAEAAAAAAAAAAANEQGIQQQGDQAEQTANNDAGSPAHHPEHAPERAIPLQT
ncbi:hypothetical protein GE21DRAFT_7256 [Neurospora crassa]|uniref:Ubiquitin-like domain-containing protein n=2 Tax=Neurospora crassa TaxID=5141 RepID=F5HCG5_NEUCR|nr:hypothetical protein NCU03694 [Neurospora crassa OR74A]EAA32234.2 hypothetical protein NCU03694 [Neurospora crassa OR74A]KHE88906.1 hypothetical protein GE21DRAFT_7256 [Neurospora crassa]CAD11350.1 putative protein [Neurospora crassa]|eukprot:XP_961470.2 hypothetical protein NCU03694 [Neurospora crassa OR74A]